MNALKILWPLILASAAALVGSIPTVIAPLSRKKIQEAPIIASDIQNRLAGYVPNLFLARLDHLGHPLQDIGREARAIVIGFGKQRLLRNLKPLMSRIAVLTENDLDRIFLTLPRISERNQVVTQWVGAKIKSRDLMTGTTHLA